MFVLTKIRGQIVTDYEFQLQNEISNLRSITKSLCADTKLLCAELKESLKREEIAYKAIAELREEIYELRCTN